MRKAAKSKYSKHKTHVKESQYETIKKTSKYR